MSIVTRHPSATSGIDPDRPQRQAADPLASVWVGASAGTGKTRVLTNRVLRLMLAGTLPDRILCITFTKAAASEMANRINDVLATWATADDQELSKDILDLTGETPGADTCRRARRLFAQVLDAPGGMKIQTIHAFCQALLRRFPLEAQVSPHFEPADERSAGEILRQARDGLLLDGDVRVVEALKAAAALTDEAGFLALMNSIVSDRSRMMDALDDAGGLDAAIARLYDVLGVSDDQNDDTVIADAVRDGAFDVDGLRRAVAVVAEAGSAAEKRNADIMAAFLADPTCRPDRFAAWCACFLTQSESVRATLATKAVRAASPEVDDIFRQEAARLLRVRDRLRSVRLHAASKAYLILGHALLNRYERLKEARGVLDFDDLILKAADLLTRPGVAPWVLFKLDGGLDHILIDEAQDTNPDQWRVVAALSDEFFSGISSRQDRDGIVRTIFAVGDEKQSIYSFQGANVAEFGRMRRLFADRIEAAEQVFQTVDLQVSFRSTPAVLDFVNAVFDDPAARDGLSEDGGAIPLHVAHRQGQPGLVELWPLAEMQQEQDLPGWEPLADRIAQPSPARRVARAIARTVRGWLDEGRLLAAKGRPVHPGDILILVRTRGPFFHDVVRALKEADVPVAGTDRMILSQQMAIMDLLALARFALLSRDDLVLAGLLKSPFIGLTDDDLIALAPGRAGTLWHALLDRAGERPAWTDARNWLAGILASVDFLTPFALFARVLDHPCPANSISGRRALIRRLGREAEDPLDEFLALSLSYEARHPPSLQGFLAWLDSEESDIKREQGADAGVVRVMTVHGAKGLQAPIVFLPDTLGKPRTARSVYWTAATPVPDGADPVLSPVLPPVLPLWVPNADLKAGPVIDAERAHQQSQMREYRRLLYVALTRAEDELYIGGFAGKSKVGEDCWYQLCSDAFGRLPAAGAVTLPVLSGLAPNADGPVEAMRIIDHGARSETPDEPQSDETPFAGDASPGGSSDVPDAAPPVTPGQSVDWLFRRAPDEPFPPRPLSPSRPETDEPAVRSPLDAGSRPDHFKRGRVIHVLLQTLPDLPVGDRRAAAARYLAARALGLSTREQATFLGEVMAVLEDPRFAMAFAPGSRAETPVVGRIGKGRPFILSGQIDRLAVSDTEVLIIDYKTNRPPPKSPDMVSGHYIGQLAAYRAAVAPLYPGRAVRCALLWTDAPRWMEIPDAMLDTWYGN